MQKTGEDTTEESYQVDMSLASVFASTWMEGAGELSLATITPSLSLIG